MKKKLDLIFTAFTALVLVCTMSFTAYAWFCFVQNSGFGGFLAGDVDPLVLEMARVEYGKDESYRQYESCTDYHIGMSDPETDGTYYSIVFENLSFGSIDNLSRLKPENIIYLRLTIPKEDGDTVNFKLGNINKNGSFFDIYKNVYDTDGETVLGQVKLDSSNPEDAAILEGFNNIQNGEGGDCYLQYSYAFSKEAIAPEELSQYETDKKLVFSTPVADFIGAEAYDGAPTADLTYDKHGELADGENYYLYIKITPNLTAFGRSIEFLAEIMPCYTMFHVKAEIEIIPKN